MKVFKTVSVDGKKLCSYNHLENTTNKYYGTLTVSYGKGRKTKPKVGFLYAFRSLEDAKDFGWGHQREIWECEAEVSRKKPILCDVFKHQDKDLKAFWKRVELKQSIVDYKEDFRTTPKGTVLCKSITLVKKVVDSKPY